MYKVNYLETALEDLKNLDKPTLTRIKSKIENHLVKDPNGLGKPLQGTLKGLWKYRIGDFRVIYKIISKDVLILIAQIGHRKEIYREK